MINPGLLKFELLTSGVHYKITGPQRLPSTGAIELILPEEIWVKAPLDSSSPLSIIDSPEGPLLCRNGSAISIQLLPPPHFYGRRTSRGVPFGVIGNVHGRRLSVCLTGGCAFLTHDTEATCKYCTAQSRIPSPTGKIGIPDLLETIDAALTENTADLLQIHIGCLPSEDRGVRFLEPYLRAVRENFDISLAVQLSPPKSDAWIDRLYAMGVDAVGYNLQAYNPDFAERVCPEQSKIVGRDRYFEALEYAAEIFPRGAVTSDLILGLEPLDSTVKGIDVLVSMGVIPLLPIIRPVWKRGITEGNLLDLDRGRAVFGHLFQSMKRRWGVFLGGTLRRESLFITPLEGRFFVADDTHINLWLQNFHDTKLGERISRNLSDLRRKLRVKRVSDSYTSAGL
jgi:hypothetical protein